MGVAACLAVAATAHASVPRDLLCRIARNEHPEASGRTIVLTCDWPGALHVLYCPPYGDPAARAYLFDSLCEHPDTNKRR